MPTDDLFPIDTPNALGGDTFISLDLPAVRAQWRAQAALAGELGSHSLAAWRRIVDASVQLARQDSEAAFYLWRTLLRNHNPLDAGPLLAGQVHPAAERLRAWHEQVIDALAGVQSDSAIIAGRYVPAARQSAAAVADELARLPGAAPLRALLG